MDQDEFDKIIKTSRLPIKGIKIVEYWGSTLFLVIISAFIFFPNFTNEIGSLSIQIALSTFIILIFLLIRKNILARYFKLVRVNHDIKQFKNAVLATAEELNWQIIEFEPKFLIAKQNVDWQQEGFRITILRSDGIIFFNSIIEPSISSHPFSFGVNKRNLRVFKSKLKKAVKGEDVFKEVVLIKKVAEETLWNESEWNLKNSFKRILIYIVIFIFIAVSVLITLEEPSPIVIPLLGISFYYIYQDIKVISAKKKWKNNQKNK